VNKRINKPHIAPKGSMLVAAALLLSVLLACSLGKKSEPANNNSNRTEPSTTPKTSSQADTPTTTTEKPSTESGSLNVGEASGSFTVKGETVELKYAYAGRGKRFSEDSIIVLVTDKPIPAESVAEEIESQTMFDAEKIRGLEYVFMKDGYWVRFHPSQYQESQGGTLKDYTVENGVVRGSDKSDGSFTDGKYSRSVKFVAALK